MFKNFHNWFTFPSKVSRIRNKIVFLSIRRLALVSLVMKFPKDTIYKKRLRRANKSYNQLKTYLSKYENILIKGKPS